MRFCKNSEESAPSIVRRFCPHGESGSMNGRAVLARKGLPRIATLCAFFVGSENLLTSGAKPLGAFFLFHASAGLQFLKPCCLASLSSQKSPPNDFKIVLWSFAKSPVNFHAIVAGHFQKVRSAVRNAAGSLCFFSNKIADFTCKMQPLFRKNRWFFPVKFAALPGGAVPPF